MELNDYNYNYRTDKWQLNGKDTDYALVFMSMTEDIETLVDNDYLTKEQAYDYLIGTMMDIMLLIQEIKGDLTDEE